MKKRMTKPMSFLLAIHICLFVLFIGKSIYTVHAESTLPTSGVLADGEKYIVDSNQARGYGGTGSLVIPSGTTTEICIRSGCTLTVAGYPGSGITGGDAGILLYGTLTISGEGKLIVKGGNGANGSNGAKGENAKPLSSGLGGEGGNGGGGGGAGIGGKGGNGNGENGTGMGTLQLEESLTVQKTSGTGGIGGIGGSAGSDCSVGKIRWYGGGGGGAGGAGGGGYAIGGGGGGGGKGGNGKDGSLSTAPLLDGFSGSEGGSPGAGGNGGTGADDIAGQSGGSAGSQGIITYYSSDTSQTIPSEEDNSFTFGEHYYQVIDQGMSWTNAKAYCEGLGGHLVTITSAQEQKSIFDFVKNHTKNFYWIGLSFDKDRKASWVTGEAFVYTNWNSREPNHLYEGEDYVFMYRSMGTWNDTLDTAEDRFGEWNTFTTKKGGLICEWESESDFINKGIQFPNGYNPKKDKYGFKNSMEYVDPIDSSLCRELLGPIFGTIFSSVYSNEAKGLCFGFAATTGALINDKGKISSFYYPSGIKTINYLSDMDDPHLIDSSWTNISLEEWLQAIWLYQFTPSIQAQRLNNKFNTIENLLDAVESYLDGTDTTPIILYLYNKLFLGQELAGSAHSVLVVGMRETSDEYILLIDNPNKTSAQGLSELHINKDSHEWCFLDDSSYNGLSFERVNINSFSSDLGKKLLILGAADNTISTTIDLIKIYLTYEGKHDESFQEKQNLYWTKENTERLTLTTTENGEITVAGNEIGITLNVKKDTEVSYHINESNNECSYESKQGEEFYSKIIKCYGGKMLSLIITGITDEGTVNIKENSNGFSVEGVNNLQIELQNEDQIESVVNAAVADGRQVNITVDDTNETVSTDFVEETSEGPTELSTEPLEESTTQPEQPFETDPTKSSNEGDKLCKYCHQDHGSSSWGKIVAFFHSILYFFAHLFGKM